MAQVSNFPENRNNMQATPNSNIIPSILHNGEAMEIPIRSDDNVITSGLASVTDLTGPMQLNTDCNITNSPSLPVGLITIISMLPTLSTPFNPVPMDTNNISSQNNPQMNDQKEPTASNKDPVKTHRTYSRAHKSKAEISSQNMQEAQVTAMMNKGTYKMGNGLLMRMKVFPISIYKVKGELYKDKFGSAAKGKCIKIAGKWYTPNHALKMYGRGGMRKWKKLIRFGGKGLQNLIDLGILKLHSVCCTCPVCENEIASPEASHSSQVNSPKTDDPSVQNDMEKTVQANINTEDQLYVDKATSVSSLLSVSETDNSADGEKDDSNNNYLDGNFEELNDVNTEQTIEFVVNNVENESGGILKQNFDTNEQKTSIDDSNNLQQSVLVSNADNLHTNIPSATAEAMDTNQMNYCNDQINNSNNIQPLRTYIPNVDSLQLNIPTAAMQVTTEQPGYYQPRTIITNDLNNIQQSVPNFLHIQSNNQNTLESMKVITDHPTFGNGQQRPVIVNNLSNPQMYEYVYAPSNDLQFNNLNGTVDSMQGTSQPENNNPPQTTFLTNVSNMPQRGVFVLNAENPESKIRNPTIYNVGIIRATTDQPSTNHPQSHFQTAGIQKTNQPINLQRNINIQQPGSLCAYRTIYNPQNWQSLTDELNEQANNCSLRNYESSDPSNTGIVLKRLKDMKQKLVEFYADIKQCSDDVMQMKANHSEKQGGETVEPDSSNDKRCVNCDRRATGICSICRQVYYCSIFCQKRDWTSHQFLCSQGGGQK